MQLDLQLLVWFERLVLYRRKLDDGKAQPSNLDAQTASAGSSGNDRPVLQSGDAEYLRDKKQHMDALFAGAADS